jgi:lipopolysaccharide/colanic/teichoic acid biosynthesis glycosyltransferase
MTVVTATDPIKLLAALENEGSQVAESSCGWKYEAAKRAFDIVFSLALLIMLSPLMLVVGLAIKLTSRGSIFFSQERAGKNGEPFIMYKFRTMREGAEEDRAFLSHLNYTTGPVFKIADDPRLIWVGKFLRQSSIDELPQLLNVLMGQMSIVGPRPLWVPEAQQAKGAAKFRTCVKPGLSCLWQISGRSELGYEQWVLLDLYYIRNRSFLLDLMIIIHTIPAVLSGHGAY